jgi:hypothetical protein
MPAITIHSKVTGPFFELGSRPIKEATEELIRDLIKEGEAKVEQQLYPGHGVRTGAYKASVHNSIVSSYHGVVADNNAIIGKFLDRGRYWPSTGHRYKGIGQIRKALAHLRKIAREVAGKQYARAVKRLT